MAINAADQQVIHYEFQFPDGRSWEHRVFLKEADAPVAEGPLPDWTRLAFHQCAHCPLQVEQSPHCPLAVALVGPVQVLSQSPSYEQVDVIVRWRGREIRQSTSLQRAVGSLLGALGATSGCPHTRRLKAMAWFHWPFSSSDETLYRSLGTYLLGQHLRQLRGLPADWSMNGLRELFRNLRQVNLAMVGRLRAAADEDSSLNGLILLDLLAADTLYALDQYDGELDGFFQEFFD
ncbi:MAG: hypothetical protein ABWY06_00195 [Pseudomonas sp.]|uniref:DUF6901 family protein n=1 Tax=Pseudomonas sp. TaxID=306 RepID=UPI0033989028